MSRVSAPTDIQRPTRAGALLLSLRPRAPTRVAASRARAKPRRGAAYLSEQVRCAAHGRAAIALALTRTILSERRVIYAPRLRHLTRASVFIPPFPAPTLENGNARRA